MKKNTAYFLTFLMIFMSFDHVFSQKRKNLETVKDSGTLLTDSTFSGLKLRNIGPAFMSGRIADIAIHPSDDNLWYIAVGSGGVWRTRNAGITWDPIFDKEKSYSIGCITIDPTNSHVIWVGSGENVGGRHVGYGDGIYRSKDGGEHWENMGLKESNHISRIIVHPENSNIVWVAAQGPLWSQGGDRGLYKTIDGGSTWEKTLEVNEWTGVTDVVIDPLNPDWLYAATWQRHRNVSAYLGGGPGTAIYRSMDGGETWEKLTSGLPQSDMGKIGLAISPQQPDVIYAAIELDRRTGAVYRSADRGASWFKQSATVSGATGPHYYQELYASPHQFDRLYLVDVRMQVSEDGGKTFRTMKEQNKHSDNHAIAFREDDPDYLLVGTDGGLYESFDLAENWRFMANLPVTQFYKVAVDDTEPFYYIYGGTQDNSTQGGPSRTDNYHGIRNSDWFLTLFGDGHQPATEPGNPDIMYSEWQQGNLARVDRTTGEIVFIKPQPGRGEDQERFNWDAPILVSPHMTTRLYYGSQRVWRSDNRGDSWVPVSGDLTRNEERISLPIMGKTWSWDEPWDFVAMSAYNTITSLAESPIKEGLIYAGTDDGHIQVTENGGETWRKIEVGSLPGVPATAFVNDIKADLFNENTVYVVLDNHKFGDLSPYLLKSTDRGVTWQSIRNNLPGRTLVWRIVQDHVNPSLMFSATEFGIYCTIDAGKKWVKLSGGVPTISFRDLAIQKRENDLVGASFGRGFFVFDDYRVLRHVSEEQLKNEAALFPVRDAWWYIERPVLNFGPGVGSMGADHYSAPNPPFGAVITYYLKEDYKTKSEIRKELEKELKKSDQTIVFPGWDEVEAERKQDEPKIWVTIKDNEGQVVRKLKGPVKKGFHRIAWDLRFPPSDPIILKEPVSDEEEEMRQGWLVAPGEYSASLSKEVDGIITPLSEPVSFHVNRMRQGALSGSSPEQTASFWREIDELNRSLTATAVVLKKTFERVDAMQKASALAKNDPGELDRRIHELKQKLYGIDQEINGNRSKEVVGEVDRANIKDRMNFLVYGAFLSTYGPNPSLTEALAVSRNELLNIKNQLQQILEEEITALSAILSEMGAPWIEGQEIPDPRRK
ncbi:MAG: glycosyl hydrolase [Cyclobacteriaceae bacterium]|nr:glycosyl hydrolase [Cyclobacteriaceae bacterium]